MPKKPAKPSTTPKTGKPSSAAPKAARTPPRGPQKPLQGALSRLAADGIGMHVQGDKNMSERSARALEGIARAAAKKLAAGEFNVAERVERVSETRVSVEHVPNEDATNLVTFEPDHFLWKSGGDLQTGDVEGAIVRLRPGAEVDDHMLTLVVAECHNRGALAVRVLPRPKGQTVPNESRDKPRPNWSMRDVVAQLVSESHTHDREELTQLVSTTLGKVGL